MYGISNNYQNKGYAIEASKALIKWTFENTELKSLSAIIKPENILSKNVIEKLGFKYVNNRLVSYDGDMCNLYYYKLYNN